MFLKKLEAQGFKSFADKTVLEFDKGATAIVGPNGSGKSNISDAIRWVMGEMSAKTLRGASMQDIIFAGTQTRKAVNFAEVSLVLDNSERIFDIDFEELTVTRRVFRSGESAYFINKAPCRLKDIHELFMDTGLGRDGYSIIGQGSVARILSTKAEDRRSMFEEAAGISKYKHRKEEAEHKLEAVNDNLVVINERIAGIETQLKPLSERAEKARKYLGLYEEYKALDINISVHGLRKNSENVKQTQQQLQSVSDELEELHNKESEFEQNISSLYTQSAQTDTLTEQAHDSLRKNEADISTCENDIKVGENNVKNNIAETERLSAEIDEMTGQIKLSDNEKKELEETRSQLAARIDTLDKELKVLKDEEKERECEIKRRGDEIEEMKSDAVQLMNEVASDKASVKGIDNLRTSFLERRAAVENELSAHSSGLENTLDNIEKNRGVIAEKKEKLAQMTARAENENRVYNDGQKLVGEYTNEINRLSVEYNSRVSKKRMLEDMESSYEGFANSVKAVLKAKELTGIYGTVSSLIEVDSRYVTAIETALGGAMQNIVVENEQDAKAAINHLKRIRGGRATFLPISSVNGKITVPDLTGTHGYIGVGAELVRHDVKYKGIIASLLGRTAIVDNIDNAIAISRQYGYKFRIVTLEGDVLNSGGSMSGGSTSRTGGFLSRASEIKRLAGEAEKIRADITEITAKRDKTSGELNNTRSRIEMYTGMVREYEDEVLKLESAAEHLSRTAESGTQRKNALENELEQIKQQLEISNEDIGKSFKAISDKERKIKELTKKTEEMQTEYDAAAEEKNKSSRQAVDKEMELNAAQKDLQVTEEKIHSLCSDTDNKTSGIQARQKNRDDILKQNEVLNGQINELRIKGERLRAENESLKSQIKELTSRKEGITRGLMEIQNSNKNLTEKLLTLRENRTKIENRLEKLTEEHDGVITHLWEDYELTYSQAEELCGEDDNVKEASERAAALKGQMKSLGSVDLESVDEYKQVKENYEFMFTQKTDLDESKDNLNTIITSMREQMKKSFAEQFKAINESFGKVIVELFGGGKGRLFLSEPNNVLESGIEIEVQLPGKGLQNINLYSGGEKSFIAIALLFAMLNVKPTPFCILDEIDAALDDVNVSRFATYLKNYLSTTQFIVITHRRGTMEAANVLYGVTMQEKGVSKLLSLRIDDVSEEIAN